ncbi:MAG: ABC transporter substrate-binding protein [Rubrobacteraceae bacterium]|nr:ABC transporter substrate-binding protein [Rubrobacteraceae bacterium]
MGKKSHLARLLVVLGACALAVGIAAGCWGGSQGGGSASGPIQVTTQQDIPHTDPALAYDVLSWPVVHAVFTTLITYDESAKGFVPWVATSVPEPQNHGKKYVFTLHKGIEFTNGEPVDASAFKYEIERILDPETKSSAADVYTNIVGATDYQKNPKHGTLKGVKVLSPTEIEFDLVKPDVTFLQTMAIPPASAVPRKAVEKAGPDFDSDPVGSGPMKVQTFERGSKMVLVKNKDYFDESTAAKSNEIDITIGLDPTTQIQRVEQGSADYAVDFPSSQYTQLKDNPQYKDYIIEQPINSVWYIYMNMTQKPWTNPKVREAMQYAIDKDRIVQVLAGRAYVTNQILPPKMPGYDDSIGSASPYDPDKARALLREAGYPNGFSIEFWDTNTGDLPKVDQVIQQNLSDVGIEMDLHSVSFSEWIDKGEFGQTQTGMSGWSQDYPDPSNFLDVLFSSDQIPANNWGHYSNPTVDKELNQAITMEDQSQRLALYQKTQKQILADDPIVPLWNEKKAYFRNPDIQGIRFHPVWYQVYQDWYRK